MPPDRLRPAHRRARQAPQDPHHADGHQRVERGERRVAHRDPAGARHRASAAHVPVDDPRLAPHLGRDPAGDQRDHRQRPGEHHGAVEPRRLGQPLAGARARTATHTPSSASSVPIADHRLEREARDVDRRPVARRDRVEARAPGVRVVEGQQRQRSRDRDAVLDPAVLVPAADVHGRARSRSPPGPRARRASWAASRRPRAPPSRRRAPAPAPRARRSSAGSRSAARS